MNSEIPEVVCDASYELVIKGEHWCKTIIKGVKDWGKTQISASAVFGKNTLLKRNKPFKVKKFTFSDLLARS